jgi:hypothetical protein
MCHFFWCCPTGGLNIDGIGYVFPHLYNLCRNQFHQEKRRKKKNVNIIKSQIQTVLFKVDIKIYK